MKIAILSDIHANIFALREVWSDLEKENVERIIIAGDLIGYYYWPGEVVRLLMADERVICVAGNHEFNLRNFLADTGEASKLRKKYGHGYDVCRDQLSTMELDWLLGLPEICEICFDNLSFYIRHGSLNSVDEYIYPDHDYGELLKNYSSADFTILGHTHYSFIHHNGKRALINPGSVGQARDLGGLASLVILNSDNLSVRFKRIRYDTLKVREEVERTDPDLKYLSRILER